jgi:hypothetical protein
MISFSSFVVGFIVGVMLAFTIFGGVC